MIVYLFLILYVPATLPPSLPSPRAYVTSLAEEFTSRADCERNRRELLESEAKRASVLERGRIRVVGISECIPVLVAAPGDGK